MAKKKKKKEIKLDPCNILSIAMEEKGVSVSDLRCMTSIGDKFIVQMMEGTRAIDDFHADKLAGALGIPKDSLL